MSGNLEPIDEREYKTYTPAVQAALASLNKRRVNAELDDDRTVSMTMLRRSIDRLDTKWKYHFWKKCAALLVLSGTIVNATRKIGPGFFILLDKYETCFTAFRKCVTDALVTLGNQNPDNVKLEALDGLDDCADAFYQCILSIILYLRIGGNTIRAEHYDKLFETIDHASEIVSSSLERGGLSAAKSALTSTSQLTRHVASGALYALHASGQLAGSVINKGSEAFSAAPGTIRDLANSYVDFKLGLVTKTADAAKESGSTAASVGKGIGTLIGGLGAAYTTVQTAGVGAVAAPSMVNGATQLGGQIGEALGGVIGVGAATYAGVSAADIVGKLEGVIANIGTVFVPTSAQVQQIEAEAGLKAAEETRKFEELKKTIDERRESYTLGGAMNAVKGWFGGQTDEQKLVVHKAAADSARRKYEIAQQGLEKLMNGDSIEKVANLVGVTGADVFMSKIGAGIVAVLAYAAKFATAIWTYLVGIIPALKVYFTVPLAQSGIVSTTSTLGAVIGGMTLYSLVWYAAMGTFIVYVLSKVLPRLGRWAFKIFKPKTPWDDPSKIADMEAKALENATRFSEMVATLPRATFTERENSKYVTAINMAIANLQALIGNDEAKRTSTYSAELNTLLLLRQSFLESAPDAPTQTQRQRPSDSSADVVVVSSTGDVTQPGISRSMPIGTPIAQANLLDT